MKSKFTKAFGIELKQILNQMTELESKVKTNKQKLAEKDKQLMILSSKKKSIAMCCSKKQKIQQRRKQPTITD